MTFYNILWIIIFALGGISLGILGFIDLNYFTLLLINPSMLNRLILRTEEFYLITTTPVPDPSIIPVRYQTQRLLSS